MWAVTKILLDTKYKMCYSTSFPSDEEKRVYILVKRLILDESSQSFDPQKSLWKKERGCDTQRRVCMSPTEVRNSLPFGRSYRKHAVTWKWQTLGKFLWLNNLPSQLNLWLKTKILREESSFSFSPLELDRKTKFGAWCGCVSRTHLWVAGHTTHAPNLGIHFGALAPEPYVLLACHARRTSLLRGELSWQAPKPKPFL